MQSQWHNLPSINGVMQKNSRQYAASGVAFSGSESAVTLSMDISGAYPEDASCLSWRRSFNYRNNARGASLAITDEYSLSERKAADEEHFITPGTVTELRKGVLRIQNGKKSIILTYSKNLECSVEIKELDDKRIADDWGSSLRRITLRSADNAPLKGKYIFTITNE